MPASSSTRLPVLLTGRARLATLASLCAVALPTFAVDEARGATLRATVGPGYDISLTTLDGRPVRSITAGRTFDVVVRDRSRHHNFRLAGPGYSRQTGVSFEGTTRPWRVTFRRGTWTYLCQPHALSMKSTVTVR